MSDRQLLAAAEYARQQKVLDRMVNTSDRTKTEFDFNQRFPSPHRKQMQQATQQLRSEEHTSELQSLMRISYAVFCLKKKIRVRHTLIKSITVYHQHREN